MVTTAEKTTKPATAVQQKAAGTSFFKKADGEGFFGAKESPAFFPPVQAKLTVSSPDDPQEKEADAVADKVMRMEEPVMAAALPDKKEENRQHQEEKKEEVQAKDEPGLAEKIQTKADSEGKLLAKLSSTSLWLARKAAQHQETLGGSSDTNIPINQKNEAIFSSELSPHSSRGSPPNNTSSFEQTLATTEGGGSAMPDATRSFMESRFDADFSGVRIHTGSTAEQLSSSIQAQAFAHGNDIYFNQNKYSPDSSAGRTLLAHELTHTIQQDTSPVKNKAAPKTLPRGGASLSITSAQVAKADGINLNSKEYTAIARAPASPGTSAATSGNIDLSGKSGGSTLPGEVKDFLQDHFQTSVDDIRIHLDDDAAGICRMLRVPAFTQGRHICFEPSRYAPETEEGGLLLAKQVAESFTQRSIKVAGGVGSLKAAAQEAKKEGQSSPGAAKPTQPETGLPKAKDKKKDAAKGGKGSKDKKKGEGAKGKGKQGKGDDVTGKTVKGNPKKSPTSPDEDPAFQKVIKKAKAKAKDQKQHEAADVKAAHAQKAATAVPNEAQSKAQKRKTEAMEEVAKEDKPFDAASFKADLLKKIVSITPKNLEEATEFKENNRIGEVKGAMGQKVASEKEKSAGPVEQVTEQPLAINEGDNKKPEPLPPTVKGTPPGNIGAREAAPKKKLDNEISMEEQSQSLDEEMKTNNITEEQLAKSNEPSFIAGLQEKKAAQKDAKEKPLLYRKQEAQIQQEAQLASEGEASRSMGAMFASRGKNFEGVVKQQQTAKTKDEVERAAVVQKIEGMYKNTESVVNALLTVAETTANTIFDTGAEKARQDFETYVDAEMRAYKRKRYSGFWGGLRWAKDKLVGMPDAVNKFYEVGRERYLAQMNTVITQVANVVTTNLNAAKQAIKNGKKEIADYVNGLEGSLQNVGKEAAESIQDKFDALEQTVNNTREQLIDGLAQKYVANLKKLDDRITELKEANKGLVQKAIGMLKEIWKVIKNLYQLFQTILSRIASVIGLIINDPGAFFSNLGKAFKQGFDRFQSRIGEHLENGLMIWLSTQLGVSNLKLPPKFDIGAIFNLVLQVLGVSFTTIKERAVLLFGAKKVEMMEKGVEIFQRIQKDGLGAVWDMLVEKLSDFKDIVWEAIKNFIRESVVRAAITFVLSLLNPVAAFVKACMAIYDFVMMLVRMKDRIIDLLNAILDAVALIASGSVDKAAAAVENAFAKSIPIIIGFLAALLHLNDIGAKVRGIITRIRDRIFKVIDWVLQKIYNGAKVVIDSLMGKKDSERKDSDVKKDETTGEQQLESFNVVVPFTMKGKSHTLTATSKNKKMHVIMASDNPLELREALSIAIKHLKKEKPAKWEDLTVELQGLNSEIQGEDIMREDWISSGARHPEGKGTVTLEKYIAAKLTKITKRLFEIAIQYNITDLASFFMDVPEKRYLPVDYDVRASLYTRGSNWTSGSNIRKQVIQDELEPLRKEVILLKNLNDENKAQTGFQNLMNKDKIPKGSVLKMFNPNHITDGTIKYHVDHIHPISAHWQREGGNNTNDQNRWDEMVRRDNLRVILSGPNTSKGSSVDDDPNDRAEYTKWVGLDFISQYAENNQFRAKKIDGRPFLMSENGQEIY